MSQHATRGVDHDVTRPNTVRHWVLYTLDAIECDNAEYDEETDRELSKARQRGTTPETIYEYAAGDDSIVFRNKQEIASALSEMARLAPFWNNEERPVNRRTDATAWEGRDVKYRYRLTEFGRGVLLDLGRPEKLPNRHKDDYERELPGARPAHQVGWWLPDDRREEYDLYDDEWGNRDEWISTDHPRVFLKDEASEGLDRGYSSIGKRLADLDAFEDVTFVMTVGPYRMHDLMYAIRDPFDKVVQIDVYSPMATSRSHDEVTRNIEALAYDLRKGLRTVADEYDDNAG